ncbi:hypothetical protein CEXT_456481 [Caerostris extrusa]|uniref:Uncharacterized protein n=1 Tax=Caerostris extrusa TaxID=172846 RepID=A0AAV4Y2Q4_CAEEX|nr:hypothetical protein CEXT_456481 [Caerostris extrusa]
MLSLTFYLQYEKPPMAILRGTLECRREPETMTADRGTDAARQQHLGTFPAELVCAQTIRNLKVQLALSKGNSIEKAKTLKKSLRLFKTKGFFIDDVSCLAFASRDLKPRRP